VTDRELAKLDRRLRALGVRSPLTALERARLIVRSHQQRRMTVAPDPGFREVQQLAHSRGALVRRFNFTPR
jgi:hypothetical protein